MTTYIYEPLDHSKAQIRLITIPRNLDESAPIHISIHTVTIPQRCLKTSLESALEGMDLNSEESGTDKPDYVALSYVWGSPDDPSEVLVDSAPEGADAISITRNLDVALRHIRRQTPKPVVFWIDAICIDQGNLQERSFQVALMDSIYTIARGTVVWLGPEDGESDRAMEMLGSLGEKIKYTLNGVLERHPSAPPPNPGEANLESELEPLSYNEDEYEAVVSLLERPWFTRGWVRQEIALAARAEIQCGRTKTGWDVFQNGAGCFCTKRLSPSVSDDLRIRCKRIKPNIFNICNINLVLCYYQSLRLDFGGVKFTDPRDAVYGVKSLLCIEDQELDVRPDYTLSTADVFIDVCVRIVERQSLTYFLDSCELTSISVPGLPSWVPDWSTPMAANFDIATDWSASAFISAKARYLGDGVLCVSGVLIDEVDSVRVRSDDTVDYIWSYYPGDDHVDSPYDNGKQSMTDAYCRTLALNKLRDGPPSIAGDNRQPFNEAKEALKKIWSLQEDYTGWDDLMQDPSVLRYLNICETTANQRCFFTTKSGYIGLGPVGTQPRDDLKPGDFVSVILGCDYPVILRGFKAPLTDTRPDPMRWKIVGICYTHGLMSGEAIYGELPSHYRTEYGPKTTDDERIHGKSVALSNTRTKEIKTDPAAILEEFGIKPSVWSREPHRLEVAESVLLEAGIWVRDLLLV